MWDKHIEPRVQAGIAHKAVPDKKRVTRESLHAWPPQRSETPVPLTEECKAQNAKEAAEKEAKKKARAAEKAKKAAKKE